MVTKITTNNSTTLKCEVTATALGISDTTTFEFSVNSSGDTLIVLQESSGEKDTYTYSKTDIPYSQINCNQLLSITKLFIISDAASNKVGLEYNLQQFNEYDIKVYHNRTNSVFIKEEESQ